MLTVAMISHVARSDYSQVRLMAIIIISTMRQTLEIMPLSSVYGIQYLGQTQGFIPIRII